VKRFRNKRGVGRIHTYAIYSQDQNPLLKNMKVTAEPFTRKDGGIINRYYVNLILREAPDEN